MNGSRFLLPQGSDLSWGAPAVRAAVQPEETARGSIGFVVEFGGLWRGGAGGHGASRRKALEVDLVAHGGADPG